MEKILSDLGLPPQEPSLPADTVPNMRPAALQKKCPHCAMDVPKSARVCPYCRKRLKSSPTRVAATVLILLVICIFFIPRVEQPAPAVTTKSTYTENQVIFAQEVMKSIRQIANVFEERGSLVVEFNEYLYPNDINEQLRVVRSVADADCVLKGRPRTIFFYNPGGKMMAQADNQNGIRLK
jgi:hypothetical protein